MRGRITHSPGRAVFLSRGAWTNGFLTRSPSARVRVDNGGGNLVKGVHAFSLRKCAALVFKIFFAEIRELIDYGGFN